MALSIDDIIEVSIRGVWQGQAWYNVWQYQINVVAGGDSAAEIAEAWWNHVKSTYRLLATTTISQAFLNVSLKTLMSLTGDYANFPVPTAEQAGTRTVGTFGDFLPSFAGAGVRLAVATRLTKPGQKRFPFLTDGDSTANALAAQFVTPLDNHMDIMVAPLVLGAPAALVTLDPVVVSKTAEGLVANFQPITGFAINPDVTSQVSRKAGRGI